MSAPPCACEVCREAYGDLRIERKRAAYRRSLETDTVSEQLEAVRLWSIQILAAFRVLPSQLASQLRKKPRPVKEATIAEKAHALGEIHLPTPNAYQKAILFALPLLKKHVYEGTVPAKTKTTRRAANKAARIARRQNRSK